MLIIATNQHEKHEDVGGLGTLLYITRVSYLVLTVRSHSLKSVNL